MKKLLNKCEFKQSVKNNWKLWALLTGVLCFFTTVMTIVSKSMASSASEHGRVFSVLEMHAQGGVFGMMGIILILIYAIAVGNKLVVSEVDGGTMSFTLNTPTTRRQLIFSKATFYILSLIAMCMTVGLFGTISGTAVGVDLDYGKFWLLILGLFTYSLAISGICFAASCWFNKSGNALMIGAGFPIAFFLLNTLSMMDDLSFMKYFSLNTLFDTTKVIAGDMVFTAISFVAMFAIGIVLYIVGINKFLRKDLPL